MNQTADHFLPYETTALLQSIKRHWCDSSSRSQRDPGNSVWRPAMMAPQSRKLHRTHKSAVRQKPRITPVLLLHVTRVTNSLPSATVCPQRNICYGLRPEIMNRTHENKSKMTDSTPWLPERFATWACKDYQVRKCLVAASGPTIWTSTYGLEPVLCNGLLVEPSGWAQTVHMFT